MTGALFEDARDMVERANGGLGTAKKSVAMNCIRALETERTNVSAMLPMILELYLQPDPASLIREQVARCKLERDEAEGVVARTYERRRRYRLGERRSFKDALLTSIERCPVAGAIVAAAWILRGVIPLVVN